MLRISSFIFVLSLIILISTLANAGNFGIGIHSGYGVIKYEGRTSALGDDRKSKTAMNTILLGVSGEYSFPDHDNFYTGITTDWTFGDEDRETWKENGIKDQTNNIRMFGQFYDLRLGYKNSIDHFYYRLYLSGGWDDMQFKRYDFIEKGTAESRTINEDISLWRTGGGFGLGYKLGKWALDSRAAYAYYPEGSVKNSKYKSTKFDTNGTCLDLGIGIAREITRNVGFYFGGSYTIIRLDESGVKKNVSVKDGNKEDAVYPESKIEIIAGVVNLTYAF